jgi:ethanolamine ammonia-lyase small subunit
MSNSSESRTWLALRQFTRARVGLGRTGDSLPTRALLDFGLAHAQARDAVHMNLDAEALQQQLSAAGFEFVPVHSAVNDRLQYLRRPDVGRRLAADSQQALKSRPALAAPQLVIVMADGLSALAVMRHAVPLLQALQPLLPGESIAPVVIAHQARVALGDEIGELWRAQQVLVLIGERPGLSCADSLGAYLTYAPRIGLSDAQRNCVSNIRHDGLSYAEGARRLAHLIRSARRLRLTGVALKDESDTPRLTDPGVDQSSHQTDQS